MTTTDWDREMAAYMKKVRHSTQEEVDRRTRAHDRDDWTPAELGYGQYHALIA